MRLLRTEHHRRMAWKNGGGETIEIAVYPPAADLGTFDWRVSMASVAHDGPFSMFEGIDRTLAVLEGDGLELTIAGLGDRCLTVGSEPLPFPADATTRARLLGGPITDLNVMTRRARCRHRVERRVISAFANLELASDWTLLVAMGECRLTEGTQSVSMRRGDAALSERTAASAAIAVQAPTLVYVVSIDRLA